MREKKLQRLEKDELSVLAVLANGPKLRLAIAAELGRRDCASGDSHQQALGPAWVPIALESEPPRSAVTYATARA